MYLYVMVQKIANHFEFNHSKLEVTNLQYTLRIYMAFILCNTNYPIKNKVLFTSIQFMNMLVYVIMYNKCNFTFKINIGTYINSLQTLTKGIYI